MKFRLYLLLFILIIGGANVFAQTNSGKPVLFDDDWLFWRGGALGGEKPDYKDNVCLMIGALKICPAQILLLVLTRSAR